MSWCGKVELRQENKELIERFLPTKTGQQSVTHEYGHAVQADSEHGNNWCRCYLSYLWHWFKHCPWMYPSKSCYYINRYEVEAYVQQHNPDYWKNYGRNNLCGKYTISNAKKKRKELGGAAQAWKVNVKSL